MFRTLQNTAVINSPGRLSKLLASQIKGASGPLEGVVGGGRKGSRTKIQQYTIRDYCTIRNEIKERDEREKKKKTEEKKNKKTEKKTRENKNKMKFINPSRPVIITHSPRITGVPPHHRVEEIHIISYAIFFTPVKNEKS